MMGLRSSICGCLALAFTAAGGCATTGGVENAAKEISLAVVQHADDAPSRVAGIDWLEDDYDCAVDIAKREGKLLVVELWAPWCHTCLSMKSLVLRDQALVDFSQHVVWLAADTERPENALLLDRFPPEVWPTLYVVDVARDRVIGKHLGAASAEQIIALLEEARRSSAASSESAGENAIDWVARAEAAIENGERGRADALYRRALEASSPDWPSRATVLVATVANLVEMKRWGECAAFAEVELDNTGRTASRTDFVYFVQLCAEQLGGDDPGVALLMKRAEARVADIAEDDSASLSVDDRSDALRVLRELREKDGDAAGAKDAALAQWELLQRAVAGSSDPGEIAIYHWPRTEVAMYLGRGEEMIEPLEESCAALPEQFEPPYRLAALLHHLGRTKDADHYAHRALQLAYGQRRARIHGLIAEIAKARGDRAAELEARRAAVETYRSLNPALYRESDREQAERVLDDLR